MGLASCDDDRKAIINFTIVAAKYFNDQVTVEKINDSLKEHGQAPLTEEEKNLWGKIIFAKYSLFLSSIAIMKNKSTNFNMYACYRIHI